MKQELALYIAKRTLQVLNTKKVRAARSITRTAKTREDVDYIIGMLRGRDEPVWWVLEKKV